MEEILSLWLTKLIFQIAKTVMSMETHVDHYKVIVQEQSSKIAQLELEIQRLREAASQPIVGDVTSWIEKISTLYSTKKTVHQEILALESREKITRLRIKYKHNSAEQMSLFNNSDDQVLCLFRLQMASKQFFQRFCPHLGVFQSHSNVGKSYGRRSYRIVHENFRIVGS